MALSGRLDFTNRIRTHATIVGVIVTLDLIVTLVLGATWDHIHPTPENDADKSFKHMKQSLLYVGFIELFFAIFYWIGFLKKKTACITVFLVFVFIAYVLQGLGMFGAVLEGNFLAAFGMIIVLAINSYVLLVLVQLRKMLLNNTFPDAGNTV